MYLIDSEGATGDNRFTDGDETLGTPATVLPAEYLNMLQDEIEAVVEEAEIELSKADNTQLLQAIQTLIGVLATTTAAGVIELATPGEVAAGEDAQRAVTPATLAGVLPDLGYVALTGGTEDLSQNSNGTYTYELEDFTGADIDTDAIRFIYGYWQHSGDDLLAATLSYTFPDGSIQPIEYRGFSTNDNYVGDRRLFCVPVGRNQTTAVFTLSGGALKSMQLYGIQQVERG